MKIAAITKVQDPYKTTKTLVLLASGVSMLGFVFPPLLAVGALLAVSAMLLFAVNTVLKLQFSLRWMIAVVLWFGGCMTLLSKTATPKVMAFGFLGLLALGWFLVMSVVSSSLPDEQPRAKLNELG